MTNYENEIEWMDYMNVLWKRKWLIIIPTFILVLAVGVYSFFLHKKWEIEALLMPGKFFAYNDKGQFNEITVTDPKQIAEQINAASYNYLIAAELSLEIRELPKLKAENIKETKLVRITAKENDVERAKLVLNSLFNHLKSDIDKKIEVEIKDIDTRIRTSESLIKHKELLIKDNLTEIKLKQIGKNKIQQEILSAENKSEISEERGKNILLEMKEVKKRIHELEKQQNKVLAENKGENEAVTLLLYLNEVQNNLHHYSTLDERLVNEKITQENLSLLRKEKKEDMKQSDTIIEKLRIDIDKIKNDIENVKNLIGFLKEKKARIDYAQLIKKPTPSLRPVYPQKKLNVILAGIVGLMIFTILAFFLERLEKQNVKNIK